MSDIVSMQTDKEKSAKTLTMVIYGLYAAAFFVGGIPAIIGIIINYIKKADVKGTFLESHFLWQIRTFWFGLLWAIIGIALVFIKIGFIVILINAIWVIYRIIKGGLRLNDNQSMYNS